MKKQFIISTCILLFGACVSFIFLLKAGYWKDAHASELSKCHSQLDHYTKILRKQDIQRNRCGLWKEQILTLHNVKRTELGLEPLIEHPGLNLSAEWKGELMQEYDLWQHEGINGQIDWELLKIAGADYVYAGENLANEHLSTDTMFAAWVASPKHYENIINTNYDRIGIWIDCEDNSPLVVVHYALLFQN